MVQWSRTLSHIRTADTGTTLIVSLPAPVAAPLALVLTPMPIAAPWLTAHFMAVPSHPLTDILMDLSASCTSNSGLTDKMNPVTVCMLALHLLPSQQTFHCTHSTTHFWKAYCNMNLSIYLHLLPYHFLTHTYAIILTAFSLQFIHSGGLSITDHIFAFEIWKAFHFYFVLLWLTSLLTYLFQIYFEKLIIQIAVSYKSSQFL
jgi:hypothetical protein